MRLLHLAWRRIGWVVHVLSDMLLAIVGLGILTLPGVALVYELLGGASVTMQATVYPIVIFIALAGAPFYSAGWLSLGRLLDMCLIFIASAVIVTLASVLFTPIVMELEVKLVVLRTLTWMISYGGVFGYILVQMHPTEPDAENETTAMNS